MQKPLQEFSCPKHDFDIPVFGGETKACRICEVLESQEKWLLEEGIYSLITTLCPVSQTATSLFDKIMTSEFVKESHQEERSAKRPQQGQTP